MSRPRRWLARTLIPTCLAAACFLPAVATAAEVASKPTFRLWITIGIQGQDVKLAVDTGAEQTFLLRSTAERLKLKVEPPPKGVVAGPGQAVVSTAVDVKIKIGDQEVVTNIGVVDDPPYTDIAGAVGWSWLRQNKFLIAWDAQQVFFIGEDLSEGLDGFTEIALDDKVPIAAIIPGLDSDELVYLDTGSFSGVGLSDARWSRYRRQHPDAPRTLQAQVIASSGPVATERMWAERIDLSMLALRATTVESCTRAHANLSRFQAVLGLSAMYNLHWIFDGPGGRVLVRPAPEIRWPFDYNRAGAVFLPTGGNDSLVAKVIEGGPAHAAGVRDGDVLLAVDDLDVTRWKTDPKVLPLARFWWQPAGTRLRLSIRSGAEKKTVELTLREIFRRPEPKP